MSSDTHSEHCDTIFLGVMKQYEKHRAILNFLGVMKQYEQHTATISFLVF